MAKSYDIIIIGGGMVGLTLANLLRDSGLRIGIVESSTPVKVTADADMRVSAISRASLGIFQSIGVWNDMRHERVSAFREMHVWDSMGASSVHFDSAEVGLDTLGYIIENSVIQQALLKGIGKQQHVDWLCPRKVESIELSGSLHSVRLDSKETLSCKLLVGADGAKSIVRETAGINLQRSSYQQSAIVCTVGTELQHGETAWQCFLPSGPLAFLPLGDGSSSIVWSMDDNYVEEIMSLDDDAFCRKLEDAFEFQLGAVTSAGKRASFPLSHGHADHYVQQGLALVGDAVHTIHPLAGQGANLGFLDAACLAEVIIKAKAANRQWHASHTLRKYERARKGENQLMESAMTGFKFLFGNENPILSTLRNAGLSFADQIPPLKYQLMKHAMGVNSRLG
jgi:2-octaprenylphenol hydroxylase